jgi:hypothetical protein
VKIEVAKGRPVREAAVAGAEIRMRPIIITSLTLMAGAWAIIFDPIFQGMAVSLLFGAGVATLMAVLIIPLGCISLRKRFYMEEATDSAEMVLSPKYEEIEGESIETTGAAVIEEYRTPLWMRIYSGVIALFGWVFLILRSIFIMLKMAVGAILDKFGGSSGPPPPPATSPPSSPPPPPAQPPSSGSGAAAAKTEKAGPSAAGEEPESGQGGVSEKSAEAETEPAEQKVVQKKAAADSSKPAVKKESPSVKRAPAKKAVAKKTSAEKAPATAKQSAKAGKAEKQQKAEPAARSAMTKKAPSKKTSPKSRRGIRLKDDTD